MGVTIAITSAKGGVGKTTLTVSLGIALAQLEKKVTIVDADIMGPNICLHLGMGKIQNTIHSVLSGKAAITDAVYPGPGGVKIVPGSLEFSALEEVILTSLEEHTEKLCEDDDFVLLDTPSGLSKPTIIALEASHGALLVVIPEITSISDALKTKMILGRLQVPIIGAALNRATSSENEITVREIESIIGVDVIAIIPDEAECRAAITCAIPIILLSPESPTSIAVKKLAYDISDFSRMEGFELKLSKS